MGLSLPSEAQWEYACRAGSTSALYSGPIRILGDGTALELDSIAWYKGKKGEVGQKQPNDWGIYDMLGHVWEWTADTLHPDYSGAPNDGNVWEDGKFGIERMLRGGSWDRGAQFCRSAVRIWEEPNHCSGFIGFRCARVQG